MVINRVTREISGVKQKNSESSHFKNISLFIPPERPLSTIQKYTHGIDKKISIII